MQQPKRLKIAAQDTEKALRLLREHGVDAAEDRGWGAVSREETAYRQPYGDLVSLNRCRLIADAVSQDVLREVVSDYLELLDTSSAVYERNGDYALGLFNSGWCRMLDASSRAQCGAEDNREALESGVWRCHEECWAASRRSIEEGRPVDVECPGGLRLYAAPILAGGEVVGSMNFGYGDPPRDRETLLRISSRFGIPVEELERQAAAYEARPAFVIELAKRRLQTSARVIGTIIEKKRAEDAQRRTADRLGRLQSITAALAEAATTGQALDAMIEKVMAATGADAGLVALPAAPSGEMEVVRSSGYPPHVIDALRRFPIKARNPAADAFRTGELVLVESDVEDERYPRLKALRPGDSETALAAIPLMLHGRPLGVLGLRFLKPVRFDAEHREFFLAVGRQCAQSLERARLYDAELRARQDLSAEKTRLEELFSALPVHVLTCTGPDHVIEYSNPRNQELWAGRKLMGLPLRQAMPEIGVELFSIWDRVVETGEAFQAMELAITIDRGAGPETAYFDVSLLPRCDTGGRVIGILAFGVEATSRVRARAALDKERAFGQAVLNQMPAGVTIAEAPTGKIVFWNNEARRLMGDVAPVESVTDYSGAMHPDGTPFRFDEYPLARALRNGEETMQRDILFRRSDGGVRVFSVNAAPIRDADGVIVAAARAFYDVTEQRAAQRTLELQAWLIELSRDAILTEDPQRCITGWNQGASLLYGFSAADALGERAHELLRTPPETAAEIDAALNQAGEWAGELRQVRKDGSEIIVESRHVLVRDERGAPLAVLAINRDITDRKESEKAIHEREATLRSFYESAPMMMGVVETREDDILHISDNPATAEFFGVPAGRTQGRWASEMGVSAESVRLWLENYRASEREGRPVQFEFGQTEAQCWLVTVSFIERSKNGRPRFCYVALDATHQKRAEAALRHQLGLTAAITDNAAEALILTDGKGTVTHMNAAAERMFGWTTEGIFGHALHAKLHYRHGGGRPYAASECPLLRALRDRTTLRNHEDTFFHKDGRPVQVACSIAPVMNDGEVRAAVLVVSDISERKRAEAALRETQKLESIGLLAGGIAHDFNNLLTTVLGNASLALDDASPEQTAALEGVIDAAHRAADLTKQLLAYSGKGQFVVQDIDLSKTVRKTADLVRFSIPKTVDVEFDLAEGLPALRADPSQIQQVVMNLVINAAEAIGENAAGSVRISTGSERLETGRDGLAPGDYVWISVRDNGCGMDEATRSRIFDPFFTTKFTGRGLGLAAVSGIVRAQKGGVFVDSSPGAGTTFKVLLPAAAPAAAAQARTILVVDDEPDVRSFLAQALRRQGYRILEAGNGREGLTVLEDRADEIDLVIMDVVMPVMSGSRALAELRHRRPELKVLLTSGFSEREVQRLCADCGADGFIQKPYTARRLVEKVRTLL